MSGDTLNCTISGATYDLVTQTRNGLMSAQDKEKLDNLDAAAEAKVFNFKGTVNFFSDLPTSGATGDVYNIATAGGTDMNGTEVKAGDNVVWDGTSWDVLAGTFDFELPVASATQRGGVKVGTGLEMVGDTLNVTLEVEKPLEFIGATSTTDGESGLVIKPNAGDEDKFLRGDGSWAATGTTVINMSGTATIIDTKVPAIQGALWQDVIGGTPCLKLRHDDYEYNYYYDTIERVGSVTPVLETIAPMIYPLGTAPSTVDGGLWYELESTAPVIKIHDGNYDYGWRHDSVTYKGGTADLICYLPLDSPTPNDAITGTDFAVSGSPVVVDDTPLIGRAVTAAEGSTWQFTSAAYLVTDVASSSLAVRQADIWFYLKPSILDAGKNVTILKNVVATTDGNLRIKWTYSSGTTTAEKNLEFDFTELVGKATHFSVAYTGKTTVYNGTTYKFSFFINGKKVGSVASYETSARTYAKNMLGMLPSGTAWSEHVAYNKLRLFSSVIWSEDFTPPVAADYL